MKEFLKKSWAWIVYIMVLASVVITKTFNEKVQDQNVAALQSKVENYKLKDGAMVSSNKSLQFENAQLKEALNAKEKEMANKFNDVKTVTEIVEKIKFDTIRLTYKDTVPCQFRRVGVVKNKSYSLNYITTQKGVKLSNLEVPDTITVVTGMKRKWFLGKETNTIDVSHSNEFVKVKDIKYIENKPKKKWYDTNAFKIGIGFVAGAVLIR